MTADDSFAYQFACFACSGAPVEVLEFTGGTFATLDRLAAQGALAVPPADSLPGLPDGAAYVAALRAFLAQHGYRC